MENESLEPQAAVATSPWSLPDTITRQDGWTGERMATFCETLAETGLVVDACLAAGKAVSGAYALRRRNPVFAAAWEAALTIARERLADTLLARSIEGTVEQYFKDGELVGERKVIDNRLGLAILGRLDRMAATCSCGGRSPDQRASAAGAARLDPRLRGGTVQIDWDLALNALRSGEEGAIAEALAMFEGRNANEVEEVEGPPNRESEDKFIDLSARCWKDEEGTWMTDFPPPPDFTRYEGGKWGDGDYERACTLEEGAILDADEAAAEAAGRAEEEALRDAWFTMLKKEMAGPTPRSSRP